MGVLQLTSLAYTSFYLSQFSDTRDLSREAEGRV